VALVMSALPACRNLAGYKAARESSIDRLLVKNRVYLL